jgi:hypothetical protein
MHTISLHTENGIFLFHETDSLERDIVLNELPDIIQDMIELKLLDLYFDTAWNIKRNNGPCVTVRDNDVNFYVPYHESFELNDFILYWSILYTCHHAHELISAPYGMFVSWLYNELTRSSTFYFTDKHESNYSMVYPGTLWDLQQNKTVFEENYTFLVIDAIG